MYLYCIIYIILSFGIISFVFYVNNIVNIVLYDIVPLFKHGCEFVRRQLWLLDLHQNISLMLASSHMSDNYPFQGVLNDHSFSGCRL